MAWSYKGRLAQSAADRVRFLMGDTDPSDQLTEDSEVMYAIGTQSSDELAAAFLCDALAMRYEQRVGVSLPGISIDFGERATMLRNAAIKLRLTAGGSNTGTVTAPAMVSGITRKDIVDAVIDGERLPTMTEQDEGIESDADYAPNVYPLRRPREYG